MTFKKKKNRNIKKNICSVSVVYNNTVGKNYKKINTDDVYLNDGNLLKSK